MNIKNSNNNKRGGGRTPGWGSVGTCLGGEGGGSNSATSNNGDEQIAVNQNHLRLSAVSWDVMDAQAALLNIVSFWADEYLTFCFVFFLRGVVGYVLCVVCR